jgi:hypothetical protein
VLAPDGKTRYVAVPTGAGTAIARIRVHGGSVATWADDLVGTWGIPAPTYSATGGEGLSRDGKRLIVGMAFARFPSRFAVIDTRTMRVVDKFALNGDFAYDALSPDGNTLYLIQHVDENNTNRYVVRSYNLSTHTLAPGRIADKTQQGWVMEGSAVSRTTSGDGRMVYTMYMRPGGYPFVHALDSVQRTAHCIGLPWHGDQAPLANATLALTDRGGTLAVNLEGGRTWLTVNTANWRLTHVPPVGDSSSFQWPLAGMVAALTLVLAVALLGRRRHAQEAAPVPL